MKKITEPIRLVITARPTDFYRDTKEIGWTLYLNDKVFGYKNLATDETLEAVADYVLEQGYQEMKRTLKLVKHQKSDWGKKSPSMDSGEVYRA